MPCHSARVTPTLTRAFATPASSQSPLKQRIWELIPGKQKELKEFAAAYGERDLGKVTVSQVRPAARPARDLRAPPPLLLQRVLP